MMVRHPAARSTIIHRAGHALRYQPLIVNDIDANEMIRVIHRENDTHWQRIARDECESGFTRSELPL
jgi:uncharacterized protein YgiM (DUF1202 family)